jgi:hypothetical protein
MEWCVPRFPPKKSKQSITANSQSVSGFPPIDYLQGEARLFPGSVLSNHRTLGARNPSIPDTAKSGETAAGREGKPSVRVKNGGFFL